MCSSIIGRKNLWKYRDTREKRLIGAAVQNLLDVSRRDAQSAATLFLKQSRSEICSQNNRRIDDIWFTRSRRRESTSTLYVSFDSSAVASVDRIENIITFLHWRDERILILKLSFFSL